ncbi:hypothetical protein QQS21_006435 [Conoideocrella luteorostrata]|uniref:Xylanolytic transcriptional activator regulatory domain-containing protein n=1 Tax=Conoideocrella luteorostrata TaxID=1105319 RepID=A0AAJ0G076_9HYPO|nr:hypothetical protein QQS21_006435 [Conoideocrella luteorostrata]
MCDTATPCARCVSRQLTCRYRQKSETDTVYFKPESRSSNRDGPSTASSVFLRGLTNPESETMMELFADDHAVNEKVPDLDVESKFSSMPPALVSFDNIDFGPWSFVSFLGDEFSDFGASDDVSAASELTSSVPIFTDEGRQRLQYISDEIIRELGKSHAFLASYEPSYSDNFDEDLAREVFSAESLARFVSVFFRLSHIHFSLVHIPSFGYEDTPAALVLAVAIGGALRSAPRDDAIASRRFSTVAEDYIFRHMQGIVVNETASRPTKSMLYALQATIIIHNIQFMRNDAQVRRRTLYHRLPALVAAVRQLGLSRHKHSNTMIWDEFVYEELCIRVGFWSAVSDWHQCGMFHISPQISIKEMTGDMPCRLELWDASDPESFASKVHELGYNPPPQCFSSLCNFIELLMRDKLGEWQSIPVGSLAVSDLSAATTALSSMVMSAHLNGTIMATGAALLRAFDRWQALWAAVTAKLDAAALQRIGMARHSGDVNLLVRKLVEVAMSGEEQPSFLKRVGHDSLHALYEFISNH